MAKRVSKDDFDKEVLQSELPVIVDFYSDSCIPCKQLSPILGDIEDDYEDKAKVVKVNINFDEELMEKYEVMASPTLVFFKGGEEKDDIRLILPDLPQTAYHGIGNACPEAAQ